MSVVSRLGFVIRFIRAYGCFDLCRFVLTGSDRFGGHFFARLILFGLRFFGNCNARFIYRFLVSRGDGAAEGILHQYFCLVKGDRTARHFHVKTKLFGLGNRFVVGHACFGGNLLDLNFPHG